MKRSTFLVGVLAGLAQAQPAQAELTIDHQNVQCAVADKFPRFTARFSPGADVAAARVVFQGATAEWYSVAMKAQGNVFIGVLPKPKKTLASFHYYVEVTDRAASTSRTADFTTDIVQSGTDCKKGLVASVVSAASILLQGPPGIAVLPAGFLSNGVVLAGSIAGSSTVAGVAGGASAGGSGAAGAAAGVAAGGGGLSTTAVVGIVAGVGGAAAIGVAAKSGGEDEECPACYAGTWRVDFTFTAVGNVCGNPPSVVGQPQTLPGVTFSREGRIIFPAGEVCNGCNGSVDASGNFQIPVPGDPPGQGTCPAGSASGRCTSTKTCDGNVTQGGDRITIRFNRD